jgi:hypothetical protein
VNALLSFAYALLVKDCFAALCTVGFDPHRGFYHASRHGRPSLALDLMEELRAVVADSVVLTEGAAWTAGSWRTTSATRSGCGGWRRRARTTGCGSSTRCSCAASALPTLCGCEAGCTISSTCQEEQVLFIPLCGKCVQEIEALGRPTEAADARDVVV